MDYARISKYRKLLMGFSILGILFCHYHECRVYHGLPTNILSAVLGLGTACVDIFLLLSGFGLYFSFLKNRDVIAFYRRRILRILPAYLIIALPYWVYYDIFVRRASIGDLFYDFFFGSFIFDGVHRFWFVFAIIVFYLLFPLLYKTLDMFKGKDELFLSVSVLAAIAGGAILRVIIPNIYENIRIMIERIPIFIFGIYAGKKCKEGARFSRGAIIVLFISTVLMEMFIRIDSFSSVSGYFMYYTSSVFAMSLILVFCRVVQYIEERRIRNFNHIEKFIEFLGSITLEAYLLHSAIKNIADYPSDMSKYCFFAVILPVLAAFCIHCVLGMIFKPSKMIKK